MQLVVDIGNTRTKWALFDGDLINANGVVDNTTEISFDWGSLFSKAEKALISSVRENFDFIPIANRKNSFILTSESPIPIKIDYESPVTLGSDRKANAVAASKLFPNRNCLCVDVGTCLKFDLLTSNGNYVGGAISPGLNMRAKALHDMTGKLPNITPTSPQELIGKSTFESLNSGIVNGMLAEINTICGQYSSKFDDLQIIGTGGDFIFFADALKSSIFADTFLTLKGLNYILSYQD